MLTGWNAYTGIVLRQMVLPICLHCNRVNHCLWCDGGEDRVCDVHDLLRGLDQFHFSCGYSLGLEYNWLAGYGCR